ncbi:helix-turn-helix domain-containing protein [Glycomyces sp. L485]|uniref:IclR family transcriptional regulator n=1 Tax=Glycomyces sp. L485 TaxID=2909235 RepID=UPI001F4A2B39|nr:helix-turn-helix domain-containing protein [Glycomyces sp. L485]MCH7229965.1 helix-turn-helix domain-containing protein [Glycomyces sp. L485]
MNDPKQPEPRYGPKTPLTALRIFRLLHANENGLTAQSLASRCGLALASAYRHLDSLVHMGLVYKDDDRFRIDPGAKPLDQAADHEAIDVILKEYVKDTKRDIALATLHGGALVFTHLHAPEDSESLLTNVPAYAVHSTAAGKALISALPGPERRRLLVRNGMPAFTAKTITDPDALEERLHPDEHGIWSAEGEYCEIGACLAVLADTGRFYADCIAVTTSVRASELERERERLTTALHRVVVLLKPALGPLVP